MKQQNHNQRHNYYQEALVPLLLHTLLCFVIENKNDSTILPKLSSSSQ